MTFSKINSYINPFSAGFSQARRDFHGLTTVKKIVVVALSIIMALATFFLAGIGGFATFKALVDTSLPKIDETRKKPPEEKIDIETVKLNELLNKSTGMFTQDTTTFAKMTEDQEKINEEIFQIVAQKQEPELRALLNRLKTDPGRFGLVAFGFAMSSQREILQSCKILEECDWPSQELKDRILPSIVSASILENGIVADEWENGLVIIKNPGKSLVFYGLQLFQCFRISINIEKVFGSFDFIQNPKPVSQYLAQSIGLAIKELAKDHLKVIKARLDRGENEYDLRVGVEVIIGTSKENRVPSSMLGPILPYLPAVPGMVSLILSDDGARSHLNPCAFSDEHCESLLNILKSQPYLQKLGVNTDGMSVGKSQEFERERTKDTRFQRPPVHELLALMV